MSDHEARTLSRRECLEWLAAAAATPLLLQACPRALAAESGPVKAALLIALRNESAILSEHPETIISRTKKGVAAFSPFCTHRRNKLEVARDGSISCPVHDSTFDLSGNPTGGPATRALPWFLTAVDEEGNVSVDVSKTVKQGEWAALPSWAKK